jgi:hypothetical protein
MGMGPNFIVGFLLLLQTWYKEFRVVAMNADVGERLHHMGLQIFNIFISCLI